MKHLRDVSISFTETCAFYYALFHYSRFARAGGATNFHHVKNQSRGHAKKVECSSTLKRVREQTSGQKLRRLDNYRES